MERTTQLYEGKAKKVYLTTDPDVVLVSYKDDATAFNGLKKGTIKGKGEVNNVCSNHMFRLLESKGIKTHYVEQINERETYVKKVEIVPLEVIVRNIAAGSMSKRFGVPEGKKLACPVLEFSYKNDDLGDPMINDYQIFALELATPEELEKIKTMALKVNEIHGDIILADEISPDTCRFWDAATGEKLDKDRFRRDLDDVTKGYREIKKRMGLE